MKITDHTNEVRSLRLDANEDLTQKQIADALFATGCYQRHIADEMSARVFDALEGSAIVYRKVERYVPKVA